MVTLILKEHPDIVRLIRAVDPKYRKPKVYFTDTDKLRLTGTYWDGGSRSTYTAVNIATLETGTAQQYAPPQFGGPSQALEVVIPAGVAIVETGVFQGKTATAHVYIRAAQDLPLKIAQSA
jgi:hypothetical protein